MQLQTSGQLHAQAALAPGQNDRYSLNRKLGGPRSRFWKKKNLPSGAIRTPDRYINHLAV